MKPNMLVCPHDTAKNPGRWYFLAQYAALQGMPVHFDISLDFVEFHQQLANADIVYANPQDAVHLIADRGFLPLVRPADIYDEVVFIANHKVDNPNIQSINGRSIASVTSMLITNIGLDILEREAVKPADIQSADTWLDVLNIVRAGEVAYGFMYKDTYDGLSEENRNSVNVFYVSAEKRVFHSICVNATMAADAEKWKALFLSMHTNDDGKMTLEELGIKEWYPVSDGAFAEINRLAAT